MTVPGCWADGASTLMGYAGMEVEEGISRCRRSGERLIRGSRTWTKGKGDRVQLQSADNVCRSGNRRPSLCGVCSLAPAHLSGLSFHRQLLTTISLLSPFHLPLTNKRRPYWI